MNDRTKPTKEPEVRDEHLSTADVARAAKPTKPTETMPETARATPTPSTQNGEQRPMALFTKEESANFKQRWSDIQADFVDEPRHSVEEADSLVAELMKLLAETFASERTGLENQWNRGANVSTEDLRLALQRYRSFFDRLLSLQ
jgi:hypothetical protein